MNFEKDVMGPVRIATGHFVEVPSGASWSAEEIDAGRVRICLALPAIALGDNFQEDLPASPFFALCIAWWFEHATGRHTRVLLRLTGAPSTVTRELLHWRRAALLLDEVARLLGSRFELSPTFEHQLWPTSPMVNKSRKVRASQHTRALLSEHALEVQLSTSATLLQSFPADIARLQRQLPVGMFDGSVRQSTAWTPGQASQLDLWGMSSDDQAVHIIELKTRDNCKVGIFPESLYYSRLIHHIRVGRVRGGGDSMELIRKAGRVVMWLVAPEYHPLVYSKSKSPLAWMNEAMKTDAVEMRLLPIELDQTGCRRWKLEKEWPAPSNRGRTPQD